MRFSFHFRDHFSNLICALLCFLQRKLLEMSFKNKDDAIASTAQFRIRKLKLIWSTVSILAIVGVILVSFGFTDEEQQESIHRALRKRDFIMPGEPVRPRDELDSTTWINGLYRGTLQGGSSTYKAVLALPCMLTLIKNNGSATWNKEYKNLKPSEVKKWGIPYWTINQLDDKKYSWKTKPVDENGNLDLKRCDHMVITPAAPNTPFSSEEGLIQFQDASNNEIASFHLDKASGDCGGYDPEFVVQETDGNMVLLGRKCIRCNLNLLPANSACPSGPNSQKLTGGWCSYKVNGVPAGDGIIQHCLAPMFSTGAYKDLLKKKKLEIGNDMSNEHKEELEG